MKTYIELKVWTMYNIKYNQFERKIFIILKETQKHLNINYLSFFSLSNIFLLPLILY